ncbi:hypothetical protein FACS1894137_18690 [Spirochaetia bacterium]|nr:hypothetical protein FACS1894137_18690 [Spirochaetia bacterium]
MGIAKMYLETSLFWFYYETGGAAHLQKLSEQVRQVFALIRAHKLEPYISPYITRELAHLGDEEKREKLWQIIGEYGIHILETNLETEKLAALYIAEEALPPAAFFDAAHIAITAVHRLDFMVSLNFTHIVRPLTIERVRRVNARQGLAGIGIYKPAEVVKL